MAFERKISEIFLRSIKQSVDFDFFVGVIFDWITEHKSDADWFDTLVEDQMRLFLKIIHTYSITIFETFNEDFFKEINNIKTLSKKKTSTTPNKIISFFQNNFKINIKTEFKFWGDLKESICRRNVITHNMGRIDKNYQDCTNSSLYDLNKMTGIDIPHDINYVKRSNHIVAHYIIFTFKKIAQYYNLKDINLIVKSLVEHPYYGEVNPDLLNSESYIVRYKVEFLDEDQD